MEIAPAAAPLPFVQPAQIPERKESGADQDNDGDSAAASKPAATMPSVPAGMGTSVNTAA